MDEAGLQAVIHAAYDSALDPAGWPRVLELMCTQFRCHFADLFARAEDHTVYGGIAVGLDRADYEDGLLGTWVKRNVWGQRRPPAASGEIATTREMMPKADLLRTEMYNDYLAPRGLHEGLRLALAVGGGWVQDISLLRDWKAGPFDAAERTFAGRMLPHLQRAVVLGEKLRAAEALRATGFAALEAVGQACIVLGRDGRPLLMTAEAERLLASRGALALGEGALAAASAGDARDLARLVGAAVARPGVGGSIRLGPGKGAAALVLRAMPLPAAPGALREPACLLLLGEPPRRAGEDTQDLAHRFGLTAAEATLAADLLDGRSVGEIARLRGRSVNTVRTHLARLMSKTGTSRQGELVRALLLGIDAARDPFPAHLAGCRQVALGR